MSESRPTTSTRLGLSIGMVACLASRPCGFDSRQVHQDGALRRVPIGSIVGSFTGSAPCKNSAVLVEIRNRQVLARTAAGPGTKFTGC